MFWLKTWNKVQLPTEKYKQIPPTSMGQVFDTFLHYNGLSCIFLRRRTVRFLFNPSSVGNESSSETCDCTLLNEILPAGIVRNLKRYLTIRYLRKMWLKSTYQMSTFLLKQRIVMMLYAMLKRTTSRYGRWYRGSFSFWRNFSRSSLTIFRNARLMNS